MGYFLEVRQHSKLKAEYNDQQKGWKNLLTWIVFPISSDLNDIVNVFLTRDDDVTRPKLLITPIDNIYIGKLISVTVESFCSMKYGPALHPGKSFWILPSSDEQVNSNQTRIFLNVGQGCYQWVIRTGHSQLKKCTIVLFKSNYGTWSKQI